MKRQQQLGLWLEPVLVLVQVLATGLVAWADAVQASLRVR